MGELQITNPDIPEGTFRGEFTEKESSDAIMLWYQILCTCALINLSIYGWQLYNYLLQPKTTKDQSLLTYQKAMILCAGPYVFQCAYRSFWPAQYNQRIVFLPICFCNPFVARMLATVGEVTHIIQIACGLIY